MSRTTMRRQRASTSPQSHSTIASGWLPDAGVNHVDLLPDQECDDELLDGVEECSPAQIVAYEIAASDDEGVVARESANHAPSPALEPAAAPGPLAQDRRILHGRHAMQLRNRLGAFGQDCQREALLRQPGLKTK